MFVLKPSTEIGDHHDLISDRVPRIALLGDGGCVCVQVPTQRPLAQPFNRAWKAKELVYHSPRMPTTKRKLCLMILCRSPAGSIDTTRGGIVRDGA